MALARDPGTWYAISFRYAHDRFFEEIFDILSNAQTKEQVSYYAGLLKKEGGKMMTQQQKDKIDDLVEYKWFELNATAL